MKSAGVILNLHDVGISGMSDCEQVGNDEISTCSQVVLTKSGFNSLFDSIS